MTREAKGTIDSESTFSHIKILSGNPPSAGNLIFFAEQGHYTQVILSKGTCFDIESPLPRIPQRGDSFDCGVTVEWLKGDFL